MVSALLSLVLGVLSWLGAPIAVGLIGLALGANAILKERRLPARRREQMVLGIIGVSVSGLAVVVSLLGRVLR